MIDIAVKAMLDKLPLVKLGQSLDKFFFTRYYSPVKTGKLGSPSLPPMKSCSIINAGMSGMPGWMTKNCLRP